MADPEASTSLPDRPEASTSLPDRPTRDTGPSAPRSASLAAASPVARWLIRARAYFLKEIYELRRQPLLIVSLIGGPLLVLLLFGAGYVNSNPLLRTAIVLPEGGLSGITEQQIRSQIGLNFRIDEITTDRAAAEAKLRNDELDVVQVIPPRILETVEGGKSPTIEILSNAIDPLSEGWVQYLAYAEANELNKALLREQTVNAQREAEGMQARIDDIRVDLTELNGALSPDRLSQVQDNIRVFRTTLTTLKDRLPSSVLLSEDSQFIRLRDTLGRLEASLDQIDAAITSGRVEQARERVAGTESDLDQLAGLIDVFVTISPDTVVAPIQQSYSNLRGRAYTSVVYYAPGVLALLVQHTAITLGALALVRERLMGAFEVFRVAPVNITQLLAGKYLGYTLFILLTSAVLIIAMRLIGVPQLGSWLLFFVLLLMLTLASLGVGFVISAVSQSDSQAIQLAMITLLVSIFFSGFFIALSSFAPFALLVSYCIPMTHGLEGFQSIMLRGIAPPLTVWMGLGIIAVVTFALVVMLTKRQLARS
jgi:ABC-2 type transport system permease protein